MSLRREIDQYKESVKLLGEIKDFVREYTAIYGPMKLRYLSCQFGRRLRKIEDLSMRQYVNKHVDHFATSLNEKGGIVVLLNE